MPRPPEEQIVWGIQLGKKCAHDKVTTMLQDEWENNTTATTAATPCCKSVVETESEDEDTFDEENRYIEPPSVPIYGHQGKTKQNNKCDRGVLLGKKTLEKETTQRNPKKKRKKDPNGATMMQPGSPQHKSNMWAARHVQGK